LLTIFAWAAFKLRKVLLTIITSAGHSHRQHNHTLKITHTHIHTPTHSRLKRKSKQRKNNMLVIHEKDMDVKDTPMPKIEKKKEEVEEK